MRKLRRVSWHLRKRNSINESNPASRSSSRNCRPPRGPTPPFRAAARLFAGKVHALGVSDNRDGVHMSAIAAAAQFVAEGVEPIVHVTTRDRNRIALVSDCLGAQAMGIRNLLCTTGTHQSRGPCKSARNVFDVDSIQLLGLYGGLADDGSLVGEERFEDAGPLCLGGTASPYADPMEMQIIRLSKAISAGAKFVITQPVFDVDRFNLWWGEVTKRGLHEKTAIIAGVRPLADAGLARPMPPGGRTRWFLLRFLSASPLRAIKRDSE